MTEPTVSFDVDPTGYRHWCLVIASPVATLTMRVTPNAGLVADYELKLNSYDLERRHRVERHRATTAL